MTHMSNSEIPDFLRPKLDHPDDTSAYDSAPSLKVDLKKATYRGPKVLKAIHKAAADTILAHPTITNKQLAEMFDVTQTWVSYMINAPVFQRYLEERRRDVINPLIQATTEERMKAMTNRAVDVLMEKLDKPVNEIADNTVLRALEIGSKSLGLGGNQAAQVVIEANHLNNLADRLVSLQKRAVNGETVIDVTPKGDDDAVEEG